MSTGSTITDRLDDADVMVTFNAVNHFSATGG